MRDEERIKELIAVLNEAAKEYYSNDNEIMDNLTYDRLYDELVLLEEKTGIHMSDSPTARVGYEAVNSLPKVRHASPMLSLDKTKDIEVLRGFIGERKTLLSWKMDGLTVVLTYNGGELVQAVTRGDGITGEVITNNARVFIGVPLKIPFAGELVIRGEAYITYKDFEEINSRIEDVEAKYKNPRNLCSGSVRQLNNEVTAARKVRLKVFALVEAGGVDFENSCEKQFIWLKNMGFDVVEYRAVTADTLDEAMEYFKNAVKTNEFPSDGLVALYDDIEYGRSLGSTVKFPRNAFAFKWADELGKTVLKEIEWSPSRTGLINPIAVFEPVELEGTSVSRASVHNVSIMEEMKLAPGDEILVYKANMIIPQIAENLTGSGPASPPDICPACGKKTVIRAENGVKTLICPNADCPAKALKSFALFAGRDALNIEGLSEATLEKLIAHGVIHTYADIFRMERYKDVIVNLDGFGEKSYEKLINAAKSASHTTLSRLLGALGITGIGTAVSRLICAEADDDPQKLPELSKDELLSIEGVGEVLAAEYTSWWQKPENRAKYEELLEVLTFEKTQTGGGEKLKGLVFVVTGSLVHYSNRNELKEYIQSQGGKVTGSVSKSTDYLINNDNASSSTKNRTAKELGIPIITEDEFIEKFT